MSPLDRLWQSVLRIPLSSGAVVKIYRSRLRSKQVKYRATLTDALGNREKSIAIANTPINIMLRAYDNLDSADQW